jgi:chain length determinant protein tyrosine kinase EpsG
MHSVPLTVPSRPAEGAARGVGQILVESGRLSADDAERILVFQRDSRARFGEAGQALGLITDDDLRFALSVQFDYPYLGRDSGLSRELVAAYEPHSAQVEELRALRSQLMLRWFATAPGRRGLAVVSADRREGRSFLAANLAIVFSQLGERTLLIDADLRTPRQSQLFGLGKQAGLSDMLAGRAGLEAVTPIPALRDLAVLPAGAQPPNPQELLGRQPFHKLLQVFAEDYDVILMDTPAASHCADAHTVAARAGAALLVARQGQSSLPKMAQLTQGLRDFGVGVLGSVFNEA